MTSNSLASVVTRGKTVAVEVRADGFINATKMCKTSGKAWNAYERNRTTKEFLNELSADLKVPVTDLVDSRKGGNDRPGTWVHSGVREHLSTWCGLKRKRSASGYVYTATSGLLNAVKIGMWRGSIHSLKSRYATPYGPGVEVHSVFVEDCAACEGSLHRQFDRYNLGGELFAKDHLDDYVDAMKASASTDFA